MSLRTTQVEPVYNALDITVSIAQTLARPVISLKES